MTPNLNLHNLIYDKRAKHITAWASTRLNWPRGKFSKNQEEKVNRGLTEGTNTQADRQTNTGTEPA